MSFAPLVSECFINNYLTNTSTSAVRISCGRTFLFCSQQIADAMKERRHLKYCKRSLGTIHRQLPGLCGLLYHVHHPRSDFLLQLHDLISCTFCLLVTTISFSLGLKKYAFSGWLTTDAVVQILCVLVQFADYAWSLNLNYCTRQGLPSLYRFSR